MAVFCLPLSSEFKVHKEENYNCIFTINTNFSSPFFLIFYLSFRYNWWNYWLKRTPSENKYTYSSKLATTSTTAKSTTTTTTRAPTSKVTKRQISEEEAGEKSRVTVYTTPKKAYKWGYWLPSSTEKTVSSFSNVNKKSVGSTSGIIFFSFI